MARLAIPGGHWTGLADPLTATGETAVSRHLSTSSAAPPAPSRAPGQAWSWHLLPPLCLLEKQGLSMTWEAVEPAHPFLCRGKGVLPEVSTEERRDLEEITQLGARALRLMLLS